MRAESSVKTLKRALMTATRSDGSPNWDMVARAFLQHRNTPIKDIGFSPAQLVFRHPIRDMIPVKKNSYKPSDVWVNCRQQRELALRHKVVKEKERWNAHTRSLPALDVGQHGTEQVRSSKVQVTTSTLLEWMVVEGSLTETDDI